MLDVLCRTEPAVCGEPPRLRPAAAAGTAPTHRLHGCDRPPARLRPTDHSLSPSHVDSCERLNISMTVAELAWKFGWLGWDWTASVTRAPTQPRSHQAGALMHPRLTSTAPPSCSRRDGHGLACSQGLPFCHTCGQLCRLSPLPVPSPLRPSMVYCIDPQTVQLVPLGADGGSPSGIQPLPHGV